MHGRANAVPSATTTLAGVRDARDGARAYVAAYCQAHSVGGLGGVVGRLRARVLSGLGCLSAPGA